MFARGNWSAFKIDITSLDNFRSTLGNSNLMFDHSQLAASLQTRTKLGNFSGINPFMFPRMDEIFKDELCIDAPEAGTPKTSVVMELLRVITETTEPGTRYPLITERNLKVAYGFAALEEKYRLHTSMPLYGLWFVQNEWKDVEHEASKREDAAYKAVGTPFKLVDSKQKAAIIAEVDANATITRKQFPVLIDYVEGIVFAQNTNKGVLFELQVLLRNMGVEIIPTAWKFGDNWTWPTDFLNKAYAETRFGEEFQKYAKESTIFNKEEQEEGAQDSVIANLLPSYYSTTELETDVWVSLGTPTNVSFSEKSAPISISDSANVTLVLQSQEKSRILGSTLTLQTVESRFNKKKEQEITWRKDIVAMDISTDMNLVEVGCALLKGFDLPSFKREMKKDRSVIGVENYWLKWLNAMKLGIRELTGSIATTLEIPLDGSGIAVMGATTSGSVDEAAANFKANLRKAGVTEFTLEDPE